LNTKLVDHLEQKISREIEAVSIVVVVSEIRIRKFFPNEIYRMSIPWLARTVSAQKPRSTLLSERITAALSMVEQPL